MKVRCKANSVDQLADLATRRRLAESIRLDGPDESLLVGKTYDVIALTRWKDGGLRVFLHTVDQSDFPYPYPLEMFDVTDTSIPPNWSIGFEGDSRIEIRQVGFSQWLADNRFYEKLVEGDKAAIAAYRFFALSLPKARAKQE